MYIIGTSCISAQNSFGSIDLEKIEPSAENQLRVKEPTYDLIPKGLLRRMGKAVRMGVGAALPLMQKFPDLNGIVIGTGNGGMEDCIKFLNQIVDYDEGMLTPTNFVQSTPNAIAGQIGLLSKNQGYNATHVHRGLAFENALVDTLMLGEENANNQYLLGGIDEISSYNFNIDYLAGWFKKESLINASLYESTTDGTMVGEASSLFVLTNRAQSNVPRILGCKTLHTTSSKIVAIAMQKFINNHVNSDEVDLLISGENGDQRFKAFFTACESELSDETAVARFKHLSGEYPSSSAFALWLGCEILTNQKIPTSALKKVGNNTRMKTVLIYNQFRGEQHGFILLSI